MNVTLHTVATPDPEVASAEMHDGEIVLLHLGTKTYFTLNETGTRIWQLMCQGHTLGEIGEALNAEYEVSLEQAEGSVINLASQLAAEKLVSLSLASSGELERLPQC
jgi:hypothetical protein